jgi:hypothetical protein
MRLLIWLVLAAFLSGCLPIGIRGSTMPLQGEAAMDGRLSVRTAVTETH